MTRLILCVALVGCASTYQSARVLPPGATEVGVALSRVEEPDNSEEDGVWVGDVSVRHGMSDRFDAGVHLTRIPGGPETGSFLALDPKVMLTAPGAATTFSVSLPVGVAWDESFSDAGDGTFVLAPTLYLGFEVTPGTEFVAAPKVFVFLPSGGKSDTEVGGSLGLRIGDGSRSWAFHPEVGFIHFDQGGSFLMFGVGIAAGG